MNEIDLSSTSMDNVEISMRVSSGLQSGDTFYTDLNGFQVHVIEIGREINGSDKEVLVLYLIYRYTTIVTKR